MEKYITPISPALWACQRPWTQSDVAEKYDLSNGVNWETKTQICYNTKVRTAAVCEVLNNTGSTFLPLQENTFCPPITLLSQFLLILICKNFLYCSKFREIQPRQFCG